MTINGKRDIMEKNNAYAAENRLIFRQAGVFTLNVLGSPGSGKTTLLQRILRLMQQRIRVAVIEADLATAKDARRLAESGVSVVQISTGGDSHLDALMISKVLSGFYLEDIDLLMIENVGNLISPAAFDLGEDLRMAVMSIAVDDPLQYAEAFKSSDIAVLNKMDMLELTDIDLEKTRQNIININPQIKLFQTCCREGDVHGVDELADYLISLTKNKRAAVKE